jgi:hypothetical protein
MDTRVYEVNERRPLKASDISDEQFYDAMLDVFENGGAIGPGAWASRWDIGDRLPGMPQAVIIAKAKTLIDRRKTVSGCPCGCRGDFEFTAKGLDAMETRGISRTRLKQYAKTRGVKEA